MIFIVLLFAYSQESEETCPNPPTNAIDLASQSVQTYKRLYGCHLNNKQVHASKSLVYLYWCSFSKLTDTTADGGGAIYVYTTSNKCPTGNCTIEYCTFDGCQATKGGALSIKTGQATRYFTIINCNFTNNKATSNGGAVCFEAVFATFDHCEFKNNYAQTSGSEIYFQCGETTSPERNNPLLFSSCKFERNTEEKISSMIFISWKTVSDFVFEHNEIKIDSSNDFYVFGFKGEYQENKDQMLIFTSNYITPSKDKLFATTTQNVYKIINDGFSSPGDSSGSTITNKPPITNEPVVTKEPTITNEPVVTKEPDHGNCPSPPSTAIDLANQEAQTNKKLYGCNLNNKRVYASKSLVYLYWCSFSKLTDTSADGGGAIYVYTTSSNCPTGNCTIEHCTFNECKSTKGGAILIKTAQKKRFISIKECTFENNIAQNEGGSIYFQAVFSTVDKCQFINNVAGTLGCEIYFDCFEDKNSEWDNPFLIQNSIFERSNNDLKNELIYLKWNEHSDFIFNNNEVKINTSSPSYLFASVGDVSIGTLSASENCIFPSSEYICDSSNTALLNRVQNGFPYTCIMIIPDNFEFNNTFCGELKHCEKETSDDQYVHVTIDFTEFDTFHNENNGGAIRLINCGFTANDANFKKCYSEKGGGGGIFIFNQHDHVYSISIKNITFNSCKAKYGGAIYIYSIAEQSPVIIASCKFIRNEIYQQTGGNTREQIIGGSALYLTVKKGNVNECTFVSNNGQYGMIKVSEQFDVKPEKAKMLQIYQQNDKRSSIVIKGCKFENDGNSDCCLYYEIEKQNSKLEIKNCQFSGRLAKGSHYIDGVSLIKEKPNVFIKSCNFLTDQKNAFDSKLTTIDFTHNKFMNNKISSELQITFIALAFAIVVIAALIKKNIHSNDASKNESLDEIPSESNAILI